MEATNAQSATVLSATKRAWLQMKPYCKKEPEAKAATAAQVAQWRRVVGEANQEIAKLKRELADTRERWEVERAILDEEMRSEIVDREANGARTADRYRTLFEACFDDGFTRTEKTQDRAEATYERAIASAGAIEQSIALLCTHPLSGNPGTALLVKRAHESKADA